MPSPSEVIQSLHSTLTATLEHLDLIDEAESKAKAAQTQLTATTKELDVASKRLEAVRAELVKSESDLQSKRHLVNDEAARSLRETNQQIAKAQEDLKRLQIQIAEQRKEHDAILASMAALGQRLRV